MTLNSNVLGKFQGKVEAIESELETKGNNREFGRELTNGTLMSCVSLQSSAQGKQKLQNQDPEPKA
jgi:hypothetical protein